MCSFRRPLYRRSTARALLLSAVALAIVALPAAAAPAADSVAQWQTLRPGGDTICSNGTPYTFYAREQNPERLLVHLQGGGGCWFSGNCDLKAQPTYDPFTDESDDPSGRSGIFDLANAENPVADYSMVFITYCTADVHLGDKVVTYERKGEDGVASDVQIHHKGAVNGQAALDWAFERFPKVKEIVVSGSSAGAIASPFYAGLLADHYPKARLAVFADAAGGYRTSAISDVLAVWGTPEMVKRLPRYRKVDPTTMDFETFFEVEGKHLPKAVFAEYNTNADAVQLQFLQLLGVSGIPLIDLLDENQEELGEAIGNLRLFTEEGTFHTILSQPNFYTSKAGGVRLVDWTRDLVAGKPIQNARCDC